MEIIFRIEDDEKLGPYHSKNVKSVSDWQDRGKDFEQLTPCPNDEQWNSEIAHEITSAMYRSPWKHNFNHVKFGFKALENLKTWFNKKELLKLKEMKFKVVCLIVNDAFNSRTQTMFIEENQEREIVEWERIINE